jgi:hypothetical protein
MLYGVHYSVSQLAVGLSLNPPGELYFRNLQLNVERVFIIFAYVLRVLPARLFLFNDSNTIR